MNYTLNPADKYVKEDVRVAVWKCTSCGTEARHVPKPKQCGHCGGVEFEEKSK